MLLLYVHLPIEVLTLTRVRHVSTGVTLTPTPPGSTLTGTVAGPTLTTSAAGNPTSSSGSTVPTGNGAASVNSNDIGTFVGIAAIGLAVLAL